MKNSKFIKLAGLMFACAIVVSSAQPLLVSADNGSKSDKNGKSERSKDDKKSDKRDKDDDDHDDDRKSYRKCYPWGIFHAWGIDKRLENGKGLPSGIFKKFSKCDGQYGNGTTTATTTPDTLAPKISNIRVAKATSTASISWRTNESTTGGIKYGTNSNLSSATTLNDGSLVLNHKLDLAGLAADTTYYYMITARDMNGNIKESSILNFKTNQTPSTPVVDTTAPQIMYATTVDLKATSTRAVWITNESSDSKIWISTNTPVDITTTPTASSATSVFYHDLVLSNLATSTTYYYAVQSTDASGNKGTLTGNFFQTLAQ